jgi:adenylate cyclase
VREERVGIRLATYARFIAIAIIAIWVVAQNWSEGPATVVYYLAILLGFVAIGVAQLLLSESRHRRPWQKFAFLACDVGLLSYTISSFAPALPYAIPPAMPLRFAGFPYFFVILGGAVLTFSPALVLWFGIAASFAWSGGVLSVLMQPGSFGFARLGAAIEDPTTWMSIVLDPDYVNPDNFVAQLIALVVVSAIVASAVWRARRLVLRQVEVERERSNLARYFSPNMIDELIRADASHGAVRVQNATILFADIVGFTRLTEGLAPAQIVTILRAFYSRMAQAVFAHGGSLDKYSADEVVATFGMPQPGPRDAANALACAVAMHDAITRWNAERAKAGGVAIELSIGLNYGAAALGNVGDEQRYEFAVVGDTVNLARLLEREGHDLEAGIIAADSLVQQIRAELGTGADRLLLGFVAHRGRRPYGRRDQVDVWVLPRERVTTP